MEKIKSFIKSEIVLIISFLLALTSAFFVKPSKEYINYIDFRTLALLFSLMAVMAGLQKLGVFKILAEKLLHCAKNGKQLYLVFVLLSFFSSMIITNDVTLITFVPFTLVTLKMANRKNDIIYVVTMETIAANLGSMLTPIGNPQNLFLFSKYNMTGISFLKSIFPYSLLSLVMLLIGAVFVNGEKINLQKSINNGKISQKHLVLYLILFSLSVLSVFRVLDFKILLLIVALSLLVFDRKVLKKIDYSLILTFVFLFVFIGNLGNISAVNTFLQNTVQNREVIVGVLASQIFSNVPAAVLLSGFTKNANSLLVGVNIGGLGTLIASMASLISFKFIQKEKVSTSKYFSLFTLLNIIFLALNLLLWKII